MLTRRQYFYEYRHFVGVWSACLAAADVYMGLPRPSAAIATAIYCL